MIYLAQLFQENLNDLSASSDTANSLSDDEYDRDLQEPEIKSLTEAIGHAEDLRNFANYNGYEEVAQSISKTNDLLCALKLNAPWRQMQFEEYFKPT